MNMLSWLRATIKDELAAARAATDCDWAAFGQGDDDYDPSHAEAPTIARGHGWFVSSTADAGPDIAGELRRVDAEHVVLQQPRDTIARCEADLAELDAIEAIPHQRVDGDEWFSCSQARDEYGVLSCYNDNRIGEPCDCGRDALVDRLIQIKAYGRRRWLGWREEWRP